MFLSSFHFKTILFFAFQVPEDSFQNIFDLSFDSDDSKCVIGSRGLDFLSSLSPNTLNSYNNNNNSIKNKNNANIDFDDESQAPTKSWRNGFLSSPSNSQQEELEEAFSKLYSHHRQPSSSAQVQNRLHNDFLK